MDLWQPCREGSAGAFTTIGNWRQLHRDVRYDGETYFWSKHREFLKFLEVPRRTGQKFELALSSSSLEDSERSMLTEHGWQVRDALGISVDIDAYRRYIAQSRGEFTVAKDQNIRLRSGWFSERSASYLAAGRPVITQETGFSNVLPAGLGLFGFSNLTEIEDAVSRINSDYDRHCRSALAIARDYFSYDIVLKRLLEDVGV
jgi:hypothetical protein